MGVRLTRKSLNDRSARLAMMMLGGSPIRVAVPPMLDGHRLRDQEPLRAHPDPVTHQQRHRCDSSTVVTLSRPADATAVIVHSRTSTRYGLPRARLAAQIATYSKTPVCLTTLTITIMPSSRKMTFQSMPVSSEKNAACAVARPDHQHQAGTDQCRLHPGHPLGGDGDVRAGEDGDRQRHLPGGCVHDRGSAAPSRRWTVMTPRISSLVSTTATTGEC